MTSLVLGDLILESLTPNANAHTLSGFLPNLMIFYSSWSWTLTVGRVGSNLMTWTGSDIYIYNYGFSKLENQITTLMGYSWFWLLVLWWEPPPIPFEKKAKLTLVLYWCFLFFQKTGTKDSCLLLKYLQKNWNWQLYLYSLVVCNGEETRPCLKTGPIFFF